MNEQEFIAKWQEDKPIYDAWGGYIAKKVSENLIHNGKNLGVFLKIPAQHRLKSDQSLLDKAFYRPGKNYQDPYNEIEDKVGLRFVVLLLEDIKEICEVVEKCNDWNFDPCKHFDKDKEAEPLLFTYQSVHYILRPKNEIEFNGIKINTSITCELQIRTLLQHAHAELTHDAIYKAKRRVKPKVHRTVAKSMALIETTDDFFSEVTNQLNYGPLEEHNIVVKLDSIYFKLTDLRANHLKSTIVIWDEFEQLIDDNLVESIQKFINDPNHSFISEKIKERYTENTIYQQSVVFFVFWMLKNKRRRLLKDWPLDIKLLEPLANDIGVSLNND